MHNTHITELPHGNKNLEDNTAINTSRATRLFSRPARAMLRLGTQLLNPLILSFAGSRHMPMFAVINQRGRRSGRSYSTPVGARKTADGFIIPLTFGQQADWFRNVE